MKNLAIFLLGAICGVGGTLLFLRKDIKERLEASQNGSGAVLSDESINDTGNNEKTTTGDSEGSESNIAQKTISKTGTEKVRYDKIITAVESGDNIAPVLVKPRDDDSVSLDNMDPVVTHMSDIPEGTVAIDYETFDGDNSCEKERLIYYLGDRVMSTEQGAIIQNPALLVGSDWDQYIGKYMQNTAFIRNMRLAMDYEIFIEKGFYVDEWGNEIPDED